MDLLDTKILGLLQLSGRMSVKDIAAEVNLTAPAVSERIKKLEKEGVILGYTAVVNPEKLGRPIHAIINVSIDPHDREKLIEYINGEPCIIWCHHVTGNYSYVVRIDAHEMNDIERIITDFQKLGETSTQIILSTPLSRKNIV